MTASDHLSEGQFIEAYHGTHKSGAGDSIRAFGLSSHTYSKRNATLSTSKAEAGYFATGSAGQYKNGVLATVRVPLSRQEEFLHEPINQGHSKLYGIKKPIPPEMIHRMEDLS